MSSKIIQFLHHKEKDYKGRSLLDLQFLSDEKLERTHDVIQWMFPIDLQSESHPATPILTEFDIYQMKEDVIIKLSIKRSMDRMVEFYERNTFWITQKNHNFKRITRILRCLWLIGLKHDYVSFQKCLDDVFSNESDIIGEETFLYWKNANNLGFLMGKRESIIDTTGEEQTDFNLNRFL